MSMFGLNWSVALIVLLIHIKHAIRFLCVGSMLSLSIPIFHLSPHIPPSLSGKQLKSVGK